MKLCKGCNQLKSLDNFKYAVTNKDKKTNTCKTCIAKYNRDRYRSDPFVQYIRGKRSESKKKNIPFDLDIDYLKNIWTGVCPIFNIPVSIGQEFPKNYQTSAHLDRLIPSKGYVKGNVNFISGRANVIKHDASVEELAQIIDWLKVELERATTISKESTLQANGSGSGEPL